MATISSNVPEPDFSHGDLKHTLSQLKKSQGKNVLKQCFDQCREITLENKINNDANAPCMLKERMHPNDQLIFNTTANEKRSKFHVYEKDWEKFENCNVPKDPKQFLNNLDKWIRTRQCIAVVSSLLNL